MQVVKLGGSLATSSGLKGWLARIHAHGGGRLVVVPGGEFLDQVRIARVGHSARDHVGCHQGCEADGMDPPR